MGVPFLERALVEQLPDAFRRRNVPVVIALGTDAQTLFGLFAEDRGLAAGALFPQPLGHAAFGAFHVRLSRLDLADFAGCHRSALTCLPLGSAVRQAVRLDVDDFPSPMQ